MFAETKLFLGAVNICVDDETSGHFQPLNVDLRDVCGDVVGRQDVSS